MWHSSFLGLTENLTSISRVIDLFLTISRHHFLSYSPRPTISLPSLPVYLSVSLPLSLRSFTHERTACVTHTHTHTHKQIESNLVGIGSRVPSSPFRSFPLFWILFLLILLSLFLSLTVEKDVVCSGV